MLTFEVTVSGQRITWRVVRADAGSDASAASALASRTLEGALRERLRAVPADACELADGERARVTFGRSPGARFPGLATGRQGYQTPQVVVGPSSVPGGALPQLLLTALRGYWQTDMRAYRGENLRKWDRALPAA